MPRIDLIGAPGIGKSSLLRVLARRRRSTNGRLPWLTEDEARARVAARVIRNRGILEFSAYQVFRLSPRLRKLVDRLRATPVANQSLLDMNDEWAAFIEVALEAATQTCHKPTYRSIAIQVFTDAAKQAALDYLHNRNECVLYDESLAHVPHWWAADPSGNWIEHVTRYFRLLPHPTGVIHMQGDIDQLHLRLAMRESASRRFLCHHGKSKQDLRQQTARTIAIAERGARLLEQRDVPVLEVRAGSPLRVQAREAEDFIGQVLGRECEIALSARSAAPCT